MSVYGYVRVSSKEQNEDRQMIAMQKLVIPEKNIYVDKQSEKDFDRPQFRKMVRKLKEDDILYIKSIDRLGRNYEEITCTAAAKECGMPLMTFRYRAGVKEMIKK